MFCLVWKPAVGDFVSPRGGPGLGMIWVGRRNMALLVSCHSFFEIDYETKNKTPLTSSESVGLPKGKLMQDPGWYQMGPRGHGVPSTQMGECSWGPTASSVLPVTPIPAMGRLNNGTLTTRTSLGMSEQEHMAVLSLSRDNVLSIPHPVRHL